MANDLSENTAKGSLPHQAFLVRASDTVPGAGELALGAFLTMRMVDQFRADAQPNPEALGYQVKATLNLLDGIQTDSPELGQLRQIARVGEQVMKKKEPRLLWAPMMAYAFWLEQQLRFDESVDVLDTVLGLGIVPESGDQVNAWLQRGRVLRYASRYDEATESYVTGGEMGLRLGDGHADRRSRIGRAIVLSKLGNLPASEGMLRQVIADCQTAGDQEAEAHAHHDLANTLELMGRIAEGVVEVYKAFELHEQPAKRHLALALAGMMMRALGNYPAAENAFNVVLASGPSRDTRQDTMLELLYLASFTRDRVAFERWRKELDRERSALPPDAYVDFETKLGQGYAAFGQNERAREALQAAIRRAEQYRLNTYLFRAEEALRNLETSTLHGAELVDARPVYDAHPPELDEVAEKLQLLRASA